MTSDQQRREVAARLRNGHRRDCESQITFIARMVKGRDIVTVVDVCRLPKLLADLIDRPTCNDVGDDWEFHCSACGCGLDIRDMEVGEPTMWKDGAAQVPKYCPSCGAEVVNDA